MISSQLAAGPYLEALDQLDPDEQAASRTVIEGTLLRHQARRLAAS